MSDNENTETNSDAVAASNSSALLALCEHIATEAHEGQYRRDLKTPYIEHPRKVVSLVGDDVELKAIAWLHDVLEDTELSVDDLGWLGVPSYISQCVLTLTRLRGETYDGYLQDIKNDRVATKVKIADMVANLSDAPTEKQVKKYVAALQYLIS